MGLFKEFLKVKKWGLLSVLILVAVGAALGSSGINILTWQYWVIIIGICSYIILYQLDLYKKEDESWDRIFESHERQMRSFFEVFYQNKISHIQEQKPRRGRPKGSKNKK